MDLEFVPLLETQRDLYRTPRGFERFRSYLATMVDSDTGDIDLPLVAMNPMAADHVPALLDTLIALDADAIAAAEVAKHGPQLETEPGRYKVCLVVADDARGAWTNRYATEFAHRFEEVALYKRGWIVGILWSSEPADLATVREEVAASIHRAAYIRRHGIATNLGTMIEQEGTAMARAGCRHPEIEEDDLRYTEHVIEPLFRATDRPTIMAGLFGDEGAKALGYPPLGLSHRAGLALALDRASRAAR